MRAMLSALVTVLAATAGSSAADLTVTYLVDRSALKSTTGTDVLTVDLYGDPHCDTSLHATTLAAADLELVERVATMKLRGMRRPKRAARLHVTVQDAPQAVGYWARVSGDGIVPIGSLCQAQSAPAQATLPCLSQVGTDVVVEGCNLRIRNGTNSTADMNGLGNLVLGYDDIGGDGSHNVLVGGPHDVRGFTNLVLGGSQTVEGFSNLLVGDVNRAIGAYNVATGYSNEVGGDGSVVLGGEHSRAFGYSAAVVVGRENSVIGGNSAAVGGAYGSISGDLAAIVGGFVNEAGEGSAVVGGHLCQATAGGIVVGGTGNAAAGDFAFSDEGSPTVVGGANNLAFLPGSSVFGGREGLATDGGAVLGGQGNRASNAGAVVVGGEYNLAEVSLATVTGGSFNTSLGVGAVVSGGVENRAHAQNSSVCGGSQNETLGEASTVGGGRERVVSGSYDWRAGELFEDQ